MSQLENDRAPDWTFWLNVPHISLKEGVALSLNIDPRRLKYRGGSSGELDLEESQQFWDRYLLARRNVGYRPSLGAFTNQEATPEKVRMELPGFAAWANTVDWEVPEIFTRLSGEWTNSENETSANTSKWPWGDYETKLLNVLAEAAHEFWSTYDPGQPSTAPKSKEVIDWLKSKDVPGRVAEVMAQILRADGLRPGPRR